FLKTTLFFFFQTPATTDIFILSLHDALPIFTKFAGQGVVRPIYFTILFTHTFLAAVIVPFVIVTVRRAKRGDFQRHKRIARWTLDRKSTRLNSSHGSISYAVFCLKKKI